MHRYFQLSSTFLFLGFIQACQSQAVLPPAMEIAAGYPEHEQGESQDVDPDQARILEHTLSPSNGATSVAEDFSLVYCKSDIYSDYLHNRFLNRLRQDDVEHNLLSPNQANREAQHEVFKVLNSHLPVAFGGLPVQASQRVFSWLNYFTGHGRQEFLLWLIRSESYRELLVPILDKEGLPPEFFFLAMIESGFSNTASSRTKASGTWQFMRATARHYGLQVTHWVDERRDPVKSTLAATRYLKDLHRKFGDWYLALAAYNAGPGKIVRTTKALHTRDYWTMSRSPQISPETKNYVPKLLAALIIATHPEHYGFQVTRDIRNTTPTTTVPLFAPYRLSEIAEKLSIPVEEIQRWNPELIQAVTPPTEKSPSGSYPLRLPKPLADRFAVIQSDLSRLVIQELQFHKVRPGETLSQIARIYHVSIPDIMRSNPKISPQALRTGHSITIPSPILGKSSVPIESTL